MAASLALSYEDTKKAADMRANGMINSDVCAAVYVCETTLIQSLKRHGLYVKRKAGKPRKVRK